MTLRKLRPYVPYACKCGGEFCGPVWHCRCGTHVNRHRDRCWQCGRTAEAGAVYADITDP